MRDQFAAVQHAPMLPEDAPAVFDPRQFSTRRRTSAADPEAAGGDRSAKILHSKPALEGERMQVTVLFADLKGSTELLSSNADPEDRASLRRHSQSGDGIMALFGAPLAQSLATSTPTRPMQPCRLGRRICRRSRWREL